MITESFATSPDVQKIIDKISRAQAAFDACSDRECRNEIGRILGKLQRILDATTMQEKREQMLAEPELFPNTNIRRST